MSGLLLWAYLVVLLALPLVAQWRWGFGAALLVAILELGVVLIVHRIIVDYRLIPLELSNPPPEHPKAKMVDHSFATFFRDMVTFILPALAAVTGGLLSAIWSAGVAIWSAFRNRA